MTEEPWQWPEAKWRAEVERVRAGRDLTPEKWPNGSQVAVALSFDSDHETIPLRDAATSPGWLSQGEYGSRVGVPRILRLLEEWDVPATFFIPAVSALLHPGEVADYVAGGHEVAIHGWIHERNSLLQKSDELALVARSLEVIEGLTATRPLGIRTPSWDFSPNTLDIIIELGLTYDSSLMADDNPYELVADGHPTGIVEIPVEWIRDDAPYFPMERSGGVKPHMPPRSVSQIWIDEFDHARQVGGLFQLTMHPHIVGHPSRLVALTSLMEHIRHHADVWFATHAQVAQLVGAKGSALGNAR